MDRPQPRRRRRRQQRARPRLGRRPSVCAPRRWPSDVEQSTVATLGPGKQSTAVTRDRLTAALAREAATLSGREPQPPDYGRLDFVLTLYDGANDATAETLFAAFVVDRHELLAGLFRAYGADPRAGSLLTPDVLLIFERLEHDPDRLRQVWGDHRPFDELEELASVYGIAI